MHAQELVMKVFGAFYVFLMSILAALVVLVIPVGVWFINGMTPLFGVAVSVGWLLFCAMVGAALYVILPPSSSGTPQE
jgi:hypothetical protein